MTDPTNAANIPGKGRFYTHPQTGESWPSVTNILSTAVAKPQLVAWSAKATAEAAWQALPQMVRHSRTADTDCAKRRAADRCGDCRFCLTSAIKKAHMDARDKAADLGTRVHDRAEAMVLGKPLPDDDEVEPFVRALLQFWHDFGIDPTTDFEATEMTVINRRVGYAGTLDAIMRLNGQLALVDYKTSSTRPATSVYPEHGMQLAALANAEHALLDDGTEADIPPVDAAYILNLRADTYALIPMPLAGTLSDAFAGFVGALRTTTYLHACHGAKPQPITPPSRKAAA